MAKGLSSKYLANPPNKGKHASSPESVMMKILAGRLCQEGLLGCIRTLWERAPQRVRGVCQECGRGMGCTRSTRLLALSAVL